MEGTVFYPPWLLAFVPPVVLFTLAYEFIISTLVIVISMFIMKLPGKGKIYKKLIVKTWLVGFALNGVAAIVFLIITFAGRDFAVVEHAVLNPMGSVGGFLIAFAVVAATGAVKTLVYLKILWKKNEELNAEHKKKMAMALGIITAPWLFMLPTTIVYSWTSQLLGFMYTPMVYS